MDHLKSKQEYIDRYDRNTVEQCRRTERIWDERDLPSLEDREISKEEAVQLLADLKKWYLHMEAGERYLKKEETIREWMDVDRRRDELLETAEAPENIRCLTCRNQAKPTYKELWSQMDKPDRVLFMYDCPNKCVPRRAFFSDGEEWRIKPHLCPRCDGKLDQEKANSEEKLVIDYACPNCGYADKEEIEWTHSKKEPIDEDFAVDRDRFCLTDEEGRRYQEEKWRMEQMAEFSEKWKKKDEERAEKLKANPKGFHLEGVGYTCFICGDHTPEGGNWYDEYGIKCLVCQKAIDDGEIPSSLAKDKDSWYSKFDLEHYFNVKGAILRKWMKEGIIKSRIVKRYGQGVHTELFLIQDNRGFLPPKKLVESRAVSEVKDGKTWYSSRPWHQFVNPHEHLKGYRIMEHLRVISPEEMKAREEAERVRREERRTAREAKRKKKK